MFIIEKPKLRDLMRLQVTPDWYSLGLQLEVDQHALDVIETDDGRDANTCKRKMFSKWLVSNEDTSYTSLVDALVAIEKKDVAEKVSQHFCKLCSLLNVHMHYTIRTRNNMIWSSISICNLYIILKLCYIYTHMHVHSDLPKIRILCNMHCKLSY